MLHADAGEDAVHELVEADHLCDGFVDRDLAIAVLLGQQIEVTADHRQRRAQVVRDDGHELRARPFELAQALRGLTLERVQGRLVDRQRRLVRERADERDLLVRQLDARGHA